MVAKSVVAPRLLEVTCALSYIIAPSTPFITGVTVNQNTLSVVSHILGVPTLIVVVGRLIFVKGDDASPDLGGSVIVHSINGTTFFSQIVEAFSLLPNTKFVQSAVSME